MAVNWTERNVPDQTGRHVLITAALWKISEDRTGGTYV